MKKVEKLDLVKFAQDVYSLSSPQGMGFIHYQEGGLSKEDATECVEIFNSNKKIALHMDYVYGRACKMVVFRCESGGYELDDSWFDHTPLQYTELLKRHNA